MKKLMVIDRTEEKMALAEELGMGQWKSTRQEKLDEAKAVKELTGLKFKQTTEKEVESKLRKFCWNGVPKFDGVPIYINPFSIALFVVGLVSFGIYVAPTVGPPVLGFVSVVFMSLSAALSIFLTLRGFRNCDVDNMSINRWTDNIPYGAMLAMKEAKEMGVEDFKIYYPTKHKQPVRIMIDPIIVGHKPYGPKRVESYSGNSITFRDGMLANGPRTKTQSKLMVEIFHWDDGKIYE